MDVSFYISELLTKHGEISVPGLGYLVKAYMPGYYNETDGKFYPPHYLVQFDPQTIDDDDTLTQYIADIKNISLESSKYFTEKFIANIREDALVKDVAIAEIGWFYTEQGKLMFKATSELINDPAFFGLPPVSITKVGETPIPSAPILPDTDLFTDAPPPVSESERTIRTPLSAFNTPTSAPVSEADKDETAPPVTENAKKQALIDEFNARNKAAVAEEKAYNQRQRPVDPNAETTPAAEEEYDEEPRRRPYGLIIAISILLIVIAGVFGARKFAPGTFYKAKIWVLAKIGRKGPAKVDDTKAKPDEAEAVMPAKIDSIKADSIKQARFADSIKQAKIADSVKKAKTIDPVKQLQLTKAAQKAKTADSLKLIATKKAAQKIKTADSIKQVAAAKAAQKIKTADSLKQVKAAKAAQKIKTADSLKQIKAALAAAAKSAKVVQAPIKQPVTTVVPDKPVKQPVTTVVPDKPVKTPVTKPITTTPITTHVASGALTPIEIDPAKTWVVIAKDCQSTTEAEALISSLKKKDINAFVVPNILNSKIRVAVGTYATNADADAAATVFKGKGVPDAYLTEIKPKK